jgi:hypothetical protein
MSVVASSLASEASEEKLSVLLFLLNRSLSLRLHLDVALDLGSPACRESSVGSRSGRLDAFHGGP